MSDPDKTGDGVSENGRQPEDLMLRVIDLYAGYYADLHILQGVNLDAERGKITTVLGANGVGKSTLLKAIYGFLKPQSGQVMLEGEDVVGTPTHELIHQGLAYIPQHTGIFKFMSVEENLMMGAYTFRKDKDLIKQRIEENYEDYGSWFSNAFKTAGFELMFNDQYWNPFNVEIDTQHFALVFHINALVYNLGYKPQGDEELLAVNGSHVAVQKLFGQQFASAAVLHHGLTRLEARGAARSGKTESSPGRLLLRGARSGGGGTRAGTGVLRRSVRGAEFRGERG